MVAPQHQQGELVPHVVGEGLDLAPCGREPAHRGQPCDGADPRSREGLGRTLPRVVRHVVGCADGPFQIGGVSAAVAESDAVLTRVRAHHELHGVTAAHVAGGRLHLDGLETHTGEYPVVCAAVSLELAVEAVEADVQRVGILHDELSHPEEAGLGPGFVPELGLEVIPELGQLPIGVQFRGEVGEHLLVGEGQHEVGAPAILELDHDPLDIIPPAGPLPQLGRMNHGRQELLAPDGVHLLPDDAGDLRGDPHPEREQRIGAGHELADETAPDQQAVAGRNRIRRVVAEGGNERT